MVFSMDKRVEKRHKRQVARAKNKKKMSEPDLRSPEQIEAAKEASRPETTGRGIKDKFASVARSVRNTFTKTTGSAAKTDV